MAMKKLRRVWRACILASASWAGEGPWPGGDEKQQGEQLGRQLRDAWLR
jgi:hypothetical protein